MNWILHKYHNLTYIRIRLTKKHAALCFRPSLSTSNKVVTSLSKIPSASVPIIQGVILVRKCIICFYFKYTFVCYPIPDVFKFMCWVSIVICENFFPFFLERVHLSLHEELQLLTWKTTVCQIRSMTLAYLQCLMDWV